MKLERKIPMNLQFFAEGDPAPTPAPQTTSTPAVANIDYDKLSSILDNKLDVTSKGVMKSYFKEQGLSEEDAQVAITTFKDQKTQMTQKQKDDFEAMKIKLEEYQTKEKQGVIDKEVGKVAEALEIDDKSLPHIMKLADLSKIENADGTINTEEVKKALNKVLDEVPAFKKAAQGFQKVGASEPIQTNGKPVQDSVARKSWNRFN